MNLLLVALLPLTALLSIPAPAQGQGSTGADKPEQVRAQFKIMHVDELASLLGSKDPKLTVLDANSSNTRKKQGVIPGAKLLSSFKGYDVGKELPAAKDSKLVFYCTDTR